MENGLEQGLVHDLSRDPLWPSAFGAVEAHFRRWKDGLLVPGSRTPAKSLSKRDWNALSGDLKALGLGNSTRDALLGWADAVASKASHEPLRMRLLHPMEREMLTTDAYGYLLDLYRLGLLGIAGLEQVLELCASLTRLPAQREQVEFLARKILSDDIAARGYGTAH